jgi:hypothetical protein
MIVIHCTELQLRFSSGQGTVSGYTITSINAILNELETA